MNYKDLDKAILQANLWLRHKKSLDLPDNSSELSILAVYADIYEVAETLPEVVMCSQSRCQTDNQDVQFVSSSYIRNSKKYKSFKKMEAHLRKMPLYNTFIRPKLKHRFSYRFDGNVINGKKLLSYKDNEVFIRVAYRSILGREPEKEAIRNAVVAIHKPGVSRIDILESLCQSEEGKLRQIRLNGLVKDKFLLKTKRFFLRIPILGYVLRFAAAIAFLPQRFRELYSRINDIEFSRMYELSEQIADLDQKLSTAGIQTKSVLEDYQKQLHQQYCNIQSLHNKILAYEEAQELLKQKQTQLEREKKALIDRLYYDYKSRLMEKDFETYRKESLPFLERLNQWANGRDREALRIVDLGCGFGEWVALMQEAGYCPVGVDSNTLIVEEAVNKRHLPMIEKDVFTFLKESSTESIDAIFSFHLIEHLTFNELIDFMNECYRVLKPTGLFVCATPNPENILTATKEFYMDPTHLKPVPPELLAFYMEEFGFHIIAQVKTKPRNEFPYEYREEDPLRHIVFRFNMEEESSVWAVK